MDRTPCFNTLAANKQSAKIERADAGLEELHAELTRHRNRQSPTDRENQLDES